MSTVPLVANAKVLAAGKYIPFVGTAEPVGINADAVTALVNVAFDPLSCPVNREEPLTLSVNPLVGGAMEILPLELAVI
jgi:hypothetical protein